MRLRRPSTGLLAALVVAAATAYALTTLRAYADERRAAELLLTRVEAEAGLARALERQALVHGLAALGDDLEAALAAAATALSGATASAGLDPSLAAAHVALSGLSVEIGRVLDALSGDDIAAAEAMDAEGVVPSFDALAAQLEAAQSSVRAQAEAAAGAAVVGTYSTLVAAAVLLTLFFRRAERARRQAAQLEAQRQAVSASERRFRSLVSESSDVITVVDPGGVVRYSSPGVARLLDRQPDSVIGRPFAELLPSSTDGELTVLLGQRPPTGSVPLSHQMLRADGGLVEVETVVTDLRNDPTIGGMVLNTRDVSERAALERRLVHAAFHDPLTGIPNRTQLVERLDAALARAERADGQVALLLLDLDDFKTINDSLGHVAGDEVLITAAQRVRASIRPTDLAARLSGDEFAVLLDEPGTVTVAVRVAERLGELLREPIEVAGRRVVVTASVGIVVAEPPSSAAHLLRDADAAMYRAKETGKSRFAVFEPEMHAAAIARLEMETELRGAVERDELDLVYQPILSLADRRIVAVEALLRWHHPTRGVVLPSAFISLAEETGVIREIGGWVVRAAARQLAAWQSSGVAPADMRLHINISPRQLREPNVTEELMRDLATAGLTPRDLVVEVIESGLSVERSDVAANLHAFREAGAGVAIDDFGTGYSSLARLRQLPVDIVKIDRAFVAGLASGAQEGALTRALVELANALGVEMIAEGIETDEQLSQLLAMGCRLGQGYHLGRPAPASDIAGLMANAEHKRARS